MHKIKGLCVKVVSESVENDSSKYNFKVLQLIRKGNSFVHEIQGQVYGIKEVTDKGVKMQGITLLTNGGKYMKMDKILDEDLDRKYQKGKEVKLFAVPEVRANNGRAEVFYKVVDEDYNVIDEEPRIVSIRDWESGDWPEGKELELQVNVKPYIGKRFNGIQYSVQNNGDQ